MPLRPRCGSLPIAWTPIWIAVLLLALAGPVAAQAQSALEVRGRDDQQAPQFWLLRDPETGDAVARGEGWGTAAAPAGRYRLTLVFQQPRDFVEWGEVEIVPDQVTQLVLATGLALSGREDQPPPQAWIVKESETGDLVGQSTRGWAFMPLPPGDYELTLLLESRSNFVEWGAVSVAEAEPTRLALDSGVELVAGLYPPAPQLWLAETGDGRRVAQVPDRWGFVPLPPGRYGLKVQFDRTLIRETEVEVAPGEARRLTVADLGLVHVLPQEGGGNGWDGPSLARENGLAAFSLDLGDAEAEESAPAQVIVQAGDTSEALALVPEPPAKGVWLAPADASVRVIRAGSQEVAAGIEAGELVTLAAPASAQPQPDGQSPAVEVSVAIQSPADGTVVTEPHVTVVGRAATGQQAGATQVALVIDSSGSAADPSGADLDGDGEQESILEAEVESARLLLDQLESLEGETPGTAFAVSLIRFSDEAEVVAPMTPLSDPQAGASLRQALDQVLERFGGGDTHYERAFDAALATLRDAGLTGPRIILFMSDGKPSELVTGLAAAGRAGLEGVAIHAFGLGTDFRGELPASPAIPPLPTDGAAIMATVAALGAPGGGAMKLPRPADVVEVVPRLPIVALAPAELEAVRVVNATTGEPAQEVALSPDGSFQARVPVSLLPTGDHTSNILTARATAAAGSATAEDSVTVRGDIDVEDLLGEVDELRVALDEAQSRIVVLERQAASQTDAYDRLQAACAHKDERIEMLNARWSDSQAEAAKLRREVTALEDALAGARQERDEALGEAEAARRRADALESDLDKARQRISSHDEELAGLRDERARLRSERDAAVERLDEARKRVEAAETKLAAAREEASELRAALDARSAAACPRDHGTAAPPGRLRVTAEFGGDATARALRPRVELIFDGSNSMWGQIAGEPKIAVAKRVMSAVIDRLPDETEVGLRLYGHRMSYRQPEACQDIELAYPFALIDKARLKQLIAALQPRGSTPIAAALRQVGEDVDAAGSRRVVVLVTDGKEECGGDPAEAVAGLRERGLDVLVHVIGFALEEEAAKRQMKRIASLTGGRFFDAQDRQALRSALERSLLTSFEVQDAAGARVAEGIVGRDAVALPPGRYRVVVHAPDRPVRIEDVQVASRQETVIELRQEGEAVTAEIRNP